MSTTTNVQQVKLNIMTQSQYNSATKNANELYMITDAITGTVTSVNNVSPVNGNVTISIPTQASDIGAVATTDCVDLAPVGSGWAMPSDTYEDLTLGASGTKYTASANGWVVVYKKVTSAGQYLNLQTGGSTDTTVKIQDSKMGASSSALLTCTIPVRKNQDFYVVYNASGTTNFFRFYYAVGSESEAS